MEGYSVLMFCFGGLLLIYAGILAGTKNVNLIPHHNAAKMKNERQYAEQFARVTAIVSLAPLASALTARITDNGGLSFLVLIGVFVIACIIAVRRMKNE